MQQAERNQVTIALLKARSPSCGSKMTYDVSFSGTLKEGQVVTAALLEEQGIQVFNEDDIDLINELIEGN